MIDKLRNRSALVLIAATVLLAAIWNVAGSTNVKFEQDRWKNWVEIEAELSLRWDMVEDLQENHKLIGMTRSEVTDLLGQPNVDDGTEVSYYLGMARKGINTGHLKLTFGDEQFVSEVSVWDG